MARPVQTGSLPIWALVEVDIDPPPPPCWSIPQYKSPPVVDLTSQFAALRLVMVVVPVGLTVNKDAPVEETTVKAFKDPAAG